MQQDNTQNADRFIRFSFAIDKVAKSLQKYKNDRLTQFGLKSMHLMFLISLWRNPDGMTAAELSRNCSVDKAFISRLTGELCTAGYVEYKTREISRHNNKLMLTETGRQVMSEIHQIINDSVSHIVSGIPENHLTIFYTVLNLITENLEAEAE